MARPLLEAEKAYIAGIIDGEGSISIVHRKSGAKRYYRLSCSVSNTSKELMDYLKAKAGGCVYSPNCDSPERRQNRRRLYHWGLADRASENLLREVYPYLVIKKKQAGIGLRLQESKKAPGKKGILPYVLGLREAMKRRVMALNGGAA